MIRAKTMKLLSWLSFRILVYLSVICIYYQIYLFKQKTQIKTKALSTESIDKNSSDKDIKNILSGDYFSCAINLKQEIFCWGFEPNSALFSLPSKIPQKMEVNSFSDLLFDKSLSTEISQKQKQGLLVNSGINFEHIYVQKGYRCGLTPQHDLYCWGHYLNKPNMSKINTPQPIFVYMNLPINNLKFKKLALGLNHMCGITIYSDLYCWGDNTFGQFGVEMPNYSEEPLFLPLN